MNASSYAEARSRISSSVSVSAAPTTDVNTMAIGRTTINDGRLHRLTRGSTVPAAIELPSAISSNARLAALPPFAAVKQADMTAIYMNTEDGCLGSSRCRSPEVCRLVFCCHSDQD